MEIYGASRARKILDLLDWLRDKLERLRRDVTDTHDRATLRALARACDPDTNPRLAAALMALEANQPEEEASMATNNGVRVTSMLPASGRAKPGLLTTEFWSVAGVMTASVAACIKADEPSVRIAGLIAMACLGCVLGGLYIWSRTKVKTGGHNGRDRVVGA